MLNGVLAFGGLSPWEMVIIFMVVFMLFGAKRLPEVGKSLGTGIREFKKSLTMDLDEEKETPKPKIDEKKDSNTETKI